MKIAIDAGHGLYTSGKACSKALDPDETREWTLNQRIATLVVTHLTRCGITCKRLDDVTGQTDVPLTTRSAIANSWGADYSVSIHHDAGINGGSGGGCTVYVYSGAHSVKSDALQYQVYQAFTNEVGKFGNRSNPLESADFHMVRVPKCPAILIECGFMDSKIDTPMILTEEFARKAALGIAKGICKAVDIAWVDEQVTTEVKQKEVHTMGTGDNPSEWAKEATEWAKAQGIFKGDGKGNYDWQEPLTREQLAVVLYQYGDGRK